MVKRLEAAGFLTRLRNAKDERQVLVSLTPSGRSMQGKTACLTRTLLERSGMSVDQIVELNRQVQGLREALAGK